MKLQEFSAEVLRAIVDALPHCHGTWIRGSGGHQVWSNDCGKLAVHLERDALGVPWSGLCDNHFDAATESMRKQFCEKAPWADDIREIEEIGISEEQNCIDWLLLHPKDHPEFDEVLQRLKELRIIRENPRA